MAGVILLSSLFFNADIIKISASSFKDGLQKAGAEVGYNTTETTTLAERIGKILSVSATFLGVIFLGLMIYAGYLWMMARGNEQQAETARHIIIYAVIGLIVVLAAYAITNLIYLLWFKA